MCSVYPSFYRALHLTPACQSTSGLQPTDEAHFLHNQVWMFPHMFSTVAVFFAMLQAAPSWTLSLPSCSPRMWPTHTDDLWKRSSWHDTAELCLRCLKHFSQNLSGPISPSWCSSWREEVVLLPFSTTGHPPEVLSSPCVLTDSHLLAALPQRVPLWWRSDPTAESPEGDSRGACSCATWSLLPNHKTLVIF